MVYGERLIKYCTWTREDTVGSQRTHTHTHTGRESKGIREER